MSVDHLVFEIFAAQSNVCTARRGTEISVDYSILHLKYRSDGPRNFSGPVECLQEGTEICVDLLVRFHFCELFSYIISVSVR